jgi:hypothetical protein
MYDLENLTNIKVFTSLTKKYISGFLCGDY